MRGLQCSKSLYLYNHYKQLRDPISANQQALFNRGHEVGSLAWQLFDGGVDARADNKFNYTQAFNKTQNLIKKGFSSLFEATFQEEGVLVMVDILHRKGDHWVAYEVKSSTKVTHNHVRDAALQCYVLQKAGIPLSDFLILHIDKRYRKQGPIDPEGLFQEKSIINEVLKKQDFIAEQIDHARSVLAKPTVPKIPIGEHCTNPYPCDFIGYCWRHVPNHSVFELGFLEKETKFELYKNGYETIEQIPADTDFSETVKIQVNSHKTQQPHVQKGKIIEFLSRLSYPLFFIDFEVIMPAIPIFDGTKPYEKIPFQYSLHFKETDSKQAEHYEFLAEPGNDPRYTFLTQFLADTEGTGSIIVFEDQLERRILNKLKALYPACEEEVNDRLERMIDLRHPFKNLHYYHPAMKGNFSLKAIYEALINTDGDQQSGIEHGGIASVIYEQLIEENDDVKMAEQKEQLLRYCESDTYALLKIFEALADLINQP